VVTSLSDDAQSQPFQVPGKTLFSAKASVPALNLALCVLNIEPFVTGRNKFIFTAA
jgi:hypothetical protein